MDPQVAFAVVGAFMEFTDIEARKQPDSMQPVVSFARADGEPF